MFYLYILQSVKHNRFYIGVTSNLQQRLLNHNKGYTKSTKPYRPWVLMYSEEFTVKGEAYKREYFLKHPKGYLEKIAIIKEYKRR